MIGHGFWTKEAVQTPSVDIDFSDDNIALYPENPKTLYEIVIGVKSETGSAVLYPLASINETFLSLENRGSRRLKTTRQRDTLVSRKETRQKVEKP